MRRSYCTDPLALYRLLPYAKYRHFRSRMKHAIKLRTLYRPRSPLSTLSLHQLLATASGRQQHVVSSIVLSSCRQNQPRDP